MEHLSLKENAYSVVKNMILQGEINPGERVREDLLAEKISMSRTPVREAVNQLTAEGFVKSVPRKGIYVTDLSAGEIKSLLDVREVLEVLAVSRCIDQISDAQLAQLDTILQKFEQALNRGRYKECNELDSRFHRQIASVSGNGKLIEFLNEIEDFMKIARGIEKKVQPAEKNRTTLEEHKKIFECIHSKDQPGASAAIRANIDRMKSNLGI